MATPMMLQYISLKEQYADCILFFRLGDFYEMFGEDAQEASKILNITLTARNKGTENETPMCGIPYHAAEGYIAKLTRAGKKVAICEQTSDPSEKGIVDRDVVRIVTPGTTLDDAVLNFKENNYLVSIDLIKNEYGIALVDLTTGEFKVTQTSLIDELINELHSLNPAEILIAQPLSRKSEFISLLHDISIIQEFLPSGFKTPKENIETFFKINNLSSFGLDEMKAGQSAVSNALGYLQETQKTALEHITSVHVYQIGENMQLDNATIRNLELFYNNATFGKEGSLITVIDNTLTGMGGRLLRKNIAKPLTSIHDIQHRHEIVAELIENIDLREAIKSSLKHSGDLERLIGRIGCNRTNALDFNALKDTLQQIPILKEVSKSSNHLSDLTKNLDECSELVSLLDTSIDSEPPALITIGGMIKKGYNKELDELRDISGNGKEYIAQLQARESSRTGINSLKVRYNKVFGYYIEISKANLTQVPQNYERRQTLVNAERFIIPELKEYEEKVLTAEDRIKNLEIEIFNQVRASIVKEFARIENSAQVLGLIDMLHSFAQLALRNNYTKPEMNERYGISITQGRHPVIETIQTKDHYIPNDGLFNIEDHQLILLTGPNMSGKSSYLRQTALIVLLAQIGSFVPAKSATIGVVDRIFTRIGASDNVSQGQSTFMVEMQEAASILHNATDKSLIILDELGRGTSTYDGVSIAWAIVEYIHNHIKAKTIFATHYHELIELADQLEYAQNYSIAVKEEDNRVLFLRKVIKGAINKSYGIEVAKLAGLPQELAQRASQLLNDLENKEGLSSPLQSNLFSPPSIKEPTIKAPVNDELHTAIKALNVNEITPLDALQKLKEIQDTLN